MKLNKRAAFTLIELIIVIAIISILAVAASVMVSKWMYKSRNSARLTDINQIAKGLDLVFIKDNSFPEPTISIQIDDTTNKKIGKQ